MDDVVRADWANRTPEDREGILSVHDREIVRHIQYNMQLLWSAEIEACGHGANGLVNPFDRTQLPLLSTIQFEGLVEGQGMEIAKWPKEVVTDPGTVAAALQTALNSAADPSAAASNQRNQVPKAKLPADQWPTLFQPPAKTWFGFERQLALLVEQLLLHRCGVCNGIVPAASASAAGSGREEEAAGDGGGGETSAAVTGRAAKRLRQRERRKTGRALARMVSNCAEVGGVVPTNALMGMSVVSEFPAYPLLPMAFPAMVGFGSDHVFAGEFSPDLQAHQAYPNQPHVSSMSVQNMTGNEISTPASIDPSFIDAPNTPKKKLTLDTSGKGSLSSNLGGEPAHIKSGEPAHVNSGITMATSGPKADLNEPRTASQEVKDVESAHKDESKKKETVAEKGDYMLGRGRGRAIGERRDYDPRHFGVGRGKTLAPPPGLQASPVSRSIYKGPGGLSQPWMPGPAIPEDEVEGSDEHWGLGLDSLRFFQGAASDSGDSNEAATPGRRSITSYSTIENPAVMWPETPSPASTPKLGPKDADVQGFGFELANAGALPTRSRPNRNTPRSAGVVSADLLPTYVSVPLAMSHTCPHCSQSFALPPGDDDLKLQLQQALLRNKEMQQQLVAAIQRAKKAEAARDAAEALLADSS